MFCLVSAKSIATKEILTPMNIFMQNQKNFE